MKLNLQVILSLFLSFFLVACNTQNDGGTVTPPAQGRETLEQEEISHIKSLLSDLTVDFVGNLDTIVANGETVEKFKQFFDNPHDQDNDDDDDDDFDLEELEEDLPQVIEHFFSNQRAGREENVFLFSPNPQVCPEFLAENNPDACMEAMGRVTLKLQVSGHLQGRLIFQFDEHEPFVITYGANSFTINGNMSELTPTVAHIDEIITRHEPDEALFDLPEIGGTVVLTLEKFSAARTTADLGLPENFSFNMETEDGLVDISIDSTTSLANLTFNKILRTGDLAINFNKVDVKFPDENDNDDTKTEFPYLDFRLQFDGFEGNVALDDRTQLLEFTNTGFTGGQMATLDVNGTRALEIDVAGLNFHLDASGERLIFESDSHLTPSITAYENLAFDVDGTLSIDIDNNTQVEMEKVWRQNGNSHQWSSQMYFKVNQGGVTVTGTGNIAGAILATSGVCFTETNDDDGFPFELINECTF